MRLNRRKHMLLLALLVITTGSIMVWIATTTRPNAHPDETLQADAFCYFERHWTPPDLNADGLRYSPYGWSRVYTGEIVYWVYGKLGALIQSSLPQEAPAPPAAAGEQTLLLPLLFGGDACALDYTLYRLLNVALWGITLGGLVWLGRGRRLTWAVVLLLCSLPQVLYLYAYANSDAWSLSMAALLFVYAARQRTQPTVAVRDKLVFGLLIGMVLLAKQTLWLSIPFSIALWLARPALYTGMTPVGIMRQVGARLALPLLLAGVIALPLHGLYPLSQPDYAGQVEAMREQRARDDLRPSAPTYPGYRLAARGEPFSAVLNAEWFSTSLESFYGRFGYLEVRLPGWIHGAAALLFGLGISLTLADVARRRRAYGWIEQWLLALVLAALALPLAASLYNSWTVDYQPQGRYLYAALFPLALLLAGVAEDEPTWIRRARAAVWIALLLLSHVALLTTLVLPDALR